MHRPDAAHTARAHGSLPGMRRLLAATGAALLLLLAGTGAAYADPDFGPGNSQKGPHDPGALCHPPGQTDDFPACK